MAAIVPETPENIAKKDSDLAAIEASRPEGQGCIREG
jgi:hypothetical protein